MSVHRLVWEGYFTLHEFNWNLLKHTHRLCKSLALGSPWRKKIRTQIEKLIFLSFLPLILHEIKGIPLGVCLHRWRRYFDTESSVSYVHSVFSALSHAEQPCAVQPHTRTKEKNNNRLKSNFWNLTLLNLKPSIYQEKVHSLHPCASWTDN